MNNKTKEALIGVTDRLREMGLINEASQVGLILKTAQAAGKFSVLKILLKELLEEHGWTVSSKAGEADVHLDVSSNGWGKLDKAWGLFANHLLGAAEVATNWQGMSSKIGRGYRPTVDGMIDLLEDFSVGGRNLSGANLGTFGEGGLAEQSSTSKEVIESDRTFLSALDALSENPFAERRKELMRSIKKRPSDATKSVPPESGEYATISPVDESGVFRWAEWEQRRDSAGIVTGYRRLGSTNWQIGPMHQTIPVDRSNMSITKVPPEQEAFQLGLGGMVGQRLVANIGHKSLVENKESWKKLE